MNDNIIRFENFFPNLAKLQFRYGMSTQQICKIMGVTDRTYRRYRKKNMPSTQMVERARIHFGLTLKEILS